MGLIVIIVALVGYFGSSQKNPVTGETQRVSLSPDQEIALGLQAAPQMASQHGGTETGTRDSRLVKSTGQRLVNSSDAKNSPYEFNFHLLSDNQTINAFALPGGQIFITRALYNKLETEGQLAGVLGHEIGHVIERHGAEHMAKQQLSQGIVGGVAAASDNPQAAAAMASAVANMLNMKYGRQDELESDAWGVRILVQSGYDPNAMIGVMRILRDAAGGARQPEFMSTHPDPGNRIERIKEHIKTQFPNGLPPGLKP